MGLINVPTVSFSQPFLDSRGKGEPWTVRATWQAHGTTHIRFHRFRGEPQAREFIHDKEDE